MSENRAEMSSGLDPSLDPSQARRRLAVTLGLGFSSGLPLALSGGTLTYFLARENVAVETVGLFGLASIPYTYKFLWSPLIDRVSPGPFARFGRRRGWLIVTQLGLLLAIAGTAFTHPSRRPLATLVGALAIAFFSASQDIVVDALRVESLEDENQGWGAALTQWGYRIGMFASGFGALHLADHFSFGVVYGTVAALSTLGAIATFCAIEPSVPKEPEDGSFGEILARAIVAPFRSFSARHPFAWIVAFLLVYRLGDAWAGQMTNSYLVEAGFTGGEIANVTKAFGILATLAGVAIGGFVASRASPTRSLPFAVVIMAVSNVSYAWLATRGHSMFALAVAVSIENVTSGIGGSVAIAWMSTLCEKGKAATQYALLAALTSMSRTHLGAASGYVKSYVARSLDGGAFETSAWSAYFLVTVLAGVPGILLAFYLAHRSAEQRLDQRQET